MSNPGLERITEPIGGPEALVIGLLGGIASGKSLVAKIFADLGAVVLDADRAGHEVLRQPEVEQAVRQRWGDNVFGPDGRIIRSALARVVFAPPPQGPRELEHLERITHPRIEQLLRKQIEQAAQSPHRKVLLLDAPVMIKASWHKLCNSRVFVDAPREVRLARAQARGWTENEFDAREAAQETLDVKRGLADLMIDNSGSPERTKVQVESIWHSLVG